MEQSEFEVLQVLAYFYLRNARPEKSVILLAALSVTRPEDMNVRRALAWSQIRAGKPVHALATIDQLVLKGDSDANLFLMRSEALSSLQRGDEAAVAMRAYLAHRDVNRATLHVTSP